MSMWEDYDYDPSDSDVKDLELVTMPYTKIQRSTEKAVLVEVSGKTCWLPKSQISLNEEDNMLSIAAWLLPDLEWRATTAQGGIKRRMYGY